MKIKSDYFSGVSNVHSRSGLSLAIRSLAQDLARLKVVALNPADMVDNTTGVAAAGYTDLVVPLKPFDAGAGSGAQRAGFNTAVGEFEDACKVLVNKMNTVRAVIGLPAMSAASGSEATAGTVPAQSKSVATASGTAAISFTTGLASMRAMRSNMSQLAAAADEVFVAVGKSKVTSLISGSVKSGVALPAVPDASAGLSSPNSASVSAAVADAFFGSLANNLATLIAEWDARVDAVVLDLPLQVQAG